MTRYRFRGIFLLLLMGHATACASSSWQSPSLTASPDSDVSFVDYIEIEQPEQIRITTEDRTSMYCTNHPWKAMRLLPLLARFGRCRSLIS